MATKPKSYKKNGYTYTESSPGSKKYQNFGAAKPTVKAVRDESRKDKAAVASTKVSSTTKYRGGPEGDGKAVVSKATSSPKYRGGSEGDGKMAGKQPSGPAPFSKGKGSPSVPAKKSIMGSIVDRVTQPPKQLTSASKKILADTRSEITPVIAALAGGRLLYKGGKKLVEAGSKFLSKPKPSEPYRGTSSMYVPKKVKFPKAVKGRKLTGSGTYTAN